MKTVELAYHYLAYVGQSPIPRVQPCDQPAPDEPNSWTDGSYKNPGKRLAVGSFGVWHPNRDAADLRPEECDFVTPIPQSIHGQPGGLMLAGIFLVSSKVAPEPSWLHLSQFVQAHMPYM